MSAFQTYQDALAEIERLHQIEFLHAECAGLREKDNAYLIARAEAAEAKVARVEAVVNDEFGFTYDNIRAALAGE